MKLSAPAADTSKADALTALRNNIDQASTAYYGGKEIVPNTVYDAWLRQLKLLDPTDERLTRVGPKYDRSEMRNKVEHSIICGSLDNIDGSISGYADWINSVGPGEEVVASLKLDGSSLVLSYVDGRLVLAATRGNGIIGQNVTANAVLFGGVKTALPEKWTGDIRGEAILSKKNFEILTEGVQEDEITNARSDGNGIVSRSDGTDSNLLDFIAFDMVEDQQSPTRTIMDQFANLTAWGFNVVEHRLCTTPEAVEQWFNKVMASQDDLPYTIDGLVVCINDPRVRKSLITDDPKSIYRPKYAKAIKPPVVSCGTTIIGLTRTVGHTGAIIPTAILEPVKVGGVTVQNCLLNNWDEIERLDIGIGDTLEVGLAGCVIPKVFSVIKQAENHVQIPRPTHCPECEQPVVKKGDYAHHFCVNPKCPGILLGKVHHWIGSSKKGIGILGLGDAIVEELYTAKLVRDPADLYTLTVEQLANVSMAGSSRAVMVGQSRAESIIKNIDGKRELPLHVFLGALGIELLGSRRAEQMINKAKGQLDTIEDWMDDDKLATIQMDGFGDVQRAAIRNGIKFSAELIQKLLKNGVKPLAKVKKIMTKNSKVDLSGKSFCWTGTRAGVPEVEAAGGEVKSGISKGLSYLVQKDALSVSAKTKKAESYGTKVISVDFLMKVLAGEEQLGD